MNDNSSESITEYFTHYRDVVILCINQSLSLFIIEFWILYIIFDIFIENILFKF